MLQVKYVRAKGKEGFSVLKYLLRRRDGQVRGGSMLWLLALFLEVHVLLGAAADASAMQGCAPADMCK